MLRLTEEKLLAPPYSLKPGDAEELASAVQRLKAFTSLGLSPDTAATVRTTEQLKVVLKAIGADGKTALTRASTTRDVVVWLLNSVPQLNFGDVLRLAELTTNGEVLLRLTEEKLLAPPYGLLPSAAAALIMAVAMRGTALIHATFLCYAYLCLQPSKSRYQRSVWHISCHLPLRQ